MSRPSNPKIVVCTTPLRPVPTDYPPIGSLSVLSALNKAGFDNTVFYNIDLLRPEFEEALATLEKEKPDILGISAVVSTAYSYVKKLSLEIKRRLPDTTILLGGNLGASAEILLRKTGVDFVCTGEGERTATDFVRCWTRTSIKSGFSEVKGLAFLNESGEMITTCFPEPVTDEEVYDIDWSILEDLGQISYFVIPKEESSLVHQAFSRYPETHEPHRRGKTVAPLVSAKGCVARCTFCHRWDRGIRFIPVPVLMKRIDYFIEKHNAGFISFGDENFGSNKRWLNEFLPEMKKRDLIWSVAGMRVSTISPEWIVRLKDAGCLSIHYGMESGSQRMLDIMEKVTTVEQNKNAVKWMAEQNLDSVLQLIIGMPGETQETLRETIDFTRFFAEQQPTVDPNDLSINFAQALPGTPLYEISRRKGLIGTTLDDEEAYLLRISDRDARDAETYINFTDYPTLILERWRFDIQNETRHAYIQKWGLDKYFEMIYESPRFQPVTPQKSGSDEGDSGYFADPHRAKEKLSAEPAPQKIKIESSRSADSLHDVKETLEIKHRKIPSVLKLIRERKLVYIPMLHPQLFWRLRHFALLFILTGTYSKWGLKVTLRLFWDYLKWRLVPNGPERFSVQYRSLRKLVRENFLPPIPSDSAAMEPLRKGR